MTSHGWQEHGSRPVPARGGISVGPPAGDGHGFPPAALIRVPMDGEEIIIIRALPPSASSALHPGSPGPSHRLLLCDPTLEPFLRKGRWPVPLGTCPVLLGTCPALMGTHSALLGTCPAPLWTYPAPVGSYSALRGTCSAPMGTRPALWGTPPAMLGTCPVPLWTYPALLGTHGAPLVSHPALLRTCPALLGYTFCPTADTFCPAGDTFCPAGDTCFPTGHMSCPTGDTSCPAGDTSCPTGVCSAPRGTHLAPLGTRPALLGRCPVRCGEMSCPSGAVSCPMPAVCSGHGLARGPQRGTEWCTGTNTPMHTRSCGYMHGHLCTHSANLFAPRAGTRPLGQGGTLQAASTFLITDGIPGDPGAGSASAQLLALPGQRWCLQGCWNPAVLWEQRCGGTEPCHGAGGTQDVMSRTWPGLPELCGKQMGHGTDSGFITRQYGAWH